MAVGDVYQIKAYHELSNQQLLTVYYYLSNDAAAAAGDILSAAYDVIIGPQSEMQVDDVSHVQQECINLFDDTDFASSGLPGLTGVTGSRMAVFIAASFQLVRQRRDMRHGYKRISGLIEEAVVRDQFDTGWAAYNRVTSYATALTQNLNNAVSPVDADPVVVARVKETDPNTGEVTYRLPETQAELKYYIVSSVNIQGITTQNTRK